MKTWLLALLLPIGLHAFTKVYVTTAASEIAVINANTNTFINTFIPSSGDTTAADLQGVAISPDQTTAYVVDSTNKGLWIINTSNDSTTAFVSLPDSNIPLQVAVIPDGSKVYVSDRSAASVFVMQTSDYSLSTISGGAVKPSGMAFNPSGTKLYVSDAAFGADRIYVYNTSDNTALTTISGPRASFLAVNSLGVGYAPQATSTAISTFNTATDTASSAISTTGNNLDGVAFTSDGTVAYVASNDDSTLKVITSGVQSASISLDQQPWQVAINPLDEEQIYCTTNGAPLVVVYNGAQIAVPSIEAHVTSSYYLAYIVLPFAPSSLQGEVINNDFILQTDIVHRLMWQASPSSTATGYLVSRNGTALASVTGLSYNDHNRSPDVIDFYEVQTIDATGVLSPPISLSLP